MIKLNLGCGNHILNDFVNVDCKIITDLRCVEDDIIFLNKFQDNTAELVYAAHCLQCIFPRSVIPTVLFNWYRVLTLGGKIILEVPNVIPLMKKFIAKEVPIELLIQGVYGVDHEGIRQTICFDFEYLKKLLESVGFKNVKEIEQPSYSCHCKETNICVGAWK